MSLELPPLPDIFYLVGFAAFVVILFAVLFVRISRLEKLLTAKPWLGEGVVLPSDCEPRRFGDHYMNDLILCVKRVGPTDKDVPFGDRLKRSAEP